MKKTRGYQVVRADSADELSQHVNELMRDGWSPHGSMAITKLSNHQRMFYQPMVKE